MKPYYKKLFDELVPTSFTKAQKSDFLQFCEEYCEILDGNGVFIQNKFTYEICEFTPKGIEVQVLKYNDETGDNDFFQEKVFKNELELFYFLKEKDAKYVF